ncbi:substrate-binding domain-containing protein [Ralstonia solanacearum]|uniref:substrate-binding domain-containing protein n=1 Tax=Ralstonia solanacearum TaxID=305 RepID=UPI0022A9119F|nr:substrate-binding domain-containing protein [Ralstonia solanacearum]
MAEDHLQPQVPAGDRLGRSAGPLPHRARPLWKGVTPGPAACGTKRSEAVVRRAGNTGGRQGRERMLERAGPEIVVRSADTLAEGVLMEAASRGMNVPRDLAVTGFGDLRMAARLHPALSTVKVRGADIGKRTAQVVLERFESGTHDMPMRVDTGFSIIDRGRA